MAARRFFVAANWKLNPATKTQVSELVQTLNNHTWKNDTEVVVAPSAVHVDHVRQLAKAEIGVAAQNVYVEASGAFTGENSAAMLKDLGVGWVILGHSERRNIFKETDQDVGRKVAFALKTGLSVIACVGEHLNERESNQTTQVVSRQLAAIKEHVADWSSVVIAYEPVWAIGTGKNATPEQAQEVHAHIRAWLTENVGDAARNLRIVYGGPSRLQAALRGAGSVTAKNCRDLATQKDIDGFLVGGASLKPEFVDIINARI